MRRIPEETTACGFQPVKTGRYAAVSRSTKLCQSVAMRQVERQHTMVRCRSPKATDRFKARARLTQLRNGEKTGGNDYRHTPVIRRRRTLQEREWKYK